MLSVQAAFAVAKHNLRPRIPADTPAPLAALIKQCWAANPALRPSFHAICHTLLPDVKMAVLSECMARSVKLGEAAAAAAAVAAAGGADGPTNSGSNSSTSNGSSSHRPGRHSHHMSRSS